MIWMEDTYPNSVRRMYEAIDACWTSLCWDDTYGILKSATGPDIWELSKDFFLGFWRQSFEPMPAIAVPVRDHTVLGFARQQGQHRAPAVQFDRLEDGAQ